MDDAVAAWERRGERIDLLGRSIFVLDEGPRDDHALLILHGFPSCSFDWRAVLPSLVGARRVITFDMLGYGLSEKPDEPYSLFRQADLAEALLADRGIVSIDMLTHDMGDSVGGELLARSLDDALPVTIGERVITNGSIYMDLVRLSPGQELLLALPDAMLDDELAPDEATFGAGLAATFGPSTQPSATELAAQWRLVAHNHGHRLLPRTIRYIGERRQHGDRWTGAIEAHPSPLTIVWGALDPIAVLPMAERLAGKRPDARSIILDDVGHYPMIEAPERFLASFSLRDR